MQTIKFGSKAETLESLRCCIKSAHVLPSLIFTVSAWQSSKKDILGKIQNFGSGDKIVVRSSATNEDSRTQSHAGEYCSVLNVNKFDRVSISTAIENVIASFDPNDGNQFFIQEQLENIALSGVLFTRAVDTLAPYYVINYDDLSGSTTSVTSGSTSTLKTYVRYRLSTEPAKDKRIEYLLKSAVELETLFQFDALDIEFAVTKSGELYILQVRPLTQKEKPLNVSDEAFGKLLHKVYSKIKKLNAPHPGLHGEKAVYSVMSDWNPAEMIGINPKPLSLSLYKELITDGTWAYQRDNYGYRNLRGFPLLVSLLGCPYIDVRASFNSFVPKGLSDELAGKLVDYYIARLLESPSDHDKIEFKIIFSCYYLNLTEKIKPLLNFGFSELDLDRIKFALLNLTNNICSTKGLYLQDLERIKILERRFAEITNSDLPMIDQIYWLTEDCRRYGTLPFAGLARAGFIAVQFLHSLIDLEILDKNQFGAYMRSLDTVAKQLTNDYQALQEKKISQSDFLKKYGHLRPGAYDILSPRYDDAFEMYFAEGKHTPDNSVEPSFTFDAKQLQIIDRCLINNGLEIEATNFLGFIKTAIESREYSKFVFTRNVSQILKLFEQLGLRYGYSKEDMAFVRINTVLDMYASLTAHDVSDVLKQEIENNKKTHLVTNAIKLPQLISDESDIYDFFITDTEPNYVTLSRLTSMIVVEQDFPQANLEDKIVLVRSADPGYDWLFSRRIGGLITLYGGANSHMAIRCAELQIPAVIGCGEQNFEAWSKSKILDLDCANKQVRVLR